MVRKLKLIPKEIILPIISYLEPDATWNRIYNRTIGEEGKRFATNDISYTLENLLEKNIITSKQKNKQSKVFFIGKSTNDEYEDFLKSVTKRKVNKLKQLVTQLDDKKIFTKKKEITKIIHNDFTDFITALENIGQFYTNLLHTRENSSSDKFFHEELTYLIRTTIKSINECCTQLLDGKSDNDKILIHGKIENVLWFLKI